jgi:hypothetical protein
MVRRDSETSTAIWETWDIAHASANLALFVQLKNGVTSAMVTEAALADQFVRNYDTDIALWHERQGIRM